jgi:hypothetical protein
MYLFGDTPYFSPILKRMRVALVRVTANDLVSNFPSYNMDGIQNLVFIMMN